MISHINDYSLFGATDDGMIEMLSIELGKENYTFRILEDKRYYEL